MKRTMSKIILVVLLVVVFCLFATVPALAIAQRQQTRTLTLGQQTKCLIVKNEGEQGSADAEKVDVDDARTQRA